MNSDTKSYKSLNPRVPIQSLRNHVTQDFLKLQNISLCCGLHVVFIKFTYYVYTVQIHV